MKTIFTCLFTLLTISLFCQMDSGFLSALSEEIKKMPDRSKIEVKYAKSGCWGVYEGGSITFIKKENQLTVELINKTSESSAKADRQTYQYDVNQFLAMLDEDIKIEEEKDPELIAIGNSINYVLVVEGKEVFEGASLLLPEEVVTKVSAISKFDGFFKSKSKQVFKSF